tara:strand:+ start:1427 stop:2317 length:891 start_codon:yes stop_codon:yes gene_type:complete
MLIRKINTRELVMIKQFIDEYRWLSNFAPVTIKFDGIEYASVEHAYMSAKSDDMEWKSKCADKQITAGQIKRKSKDIMLVDDWEELKLGVMEECTRLKFNEEPYRTLLEGTNHEEIEEGNTWNDTFWGINLKTGEGENNLGKLIMKIRGENRILINRRLVADFMGAKCTTSNQRLLRYDVANRPVESRETYILKKWSLDIFGDFEVIKYDTSWDWLMPVVEKIESIKDEHHGRFGVYIASNGCTIQAIKFISDKMSEPPMYFSDATLNTKLESTYYCVIKFIEFYNKHLKNKENEG